MGYATHHNDLLSVLYYNARSLFPKFDELLLTVNTRKPDIVCVTESWLNDDILDSEISIPSYQLFRRNRNRHGGGVVLFISFKFFTTQIFVHPSIELLTVVLLFGLSRICLSLFYRPPSASLEVFDMLVNYLQSVNISQYSLFLLCGDFNINIF